MHQNAYWRNGPIENNAISGVDMALWDIKGKLAEHAAVPAVRRQVPRGRADLPACGRQGPAPSCATTSRSTASRASRTSAARAAATAAAASARRRARRRSGAPDGIYLDSRKYMRDTLKMFDEIRSKVGFDVELCHDVHERLKPDRRDPVRLRAGALRAVLPRRRDSARRRRVAAPAARQDDDAAGAGRAVQQPVRMAAR